MGAKLEFQVKDYYFTEKVLRVINNQPRNSHSRPLFKKSNILKYEDKTMISNIIFISKSITNLIIPTASF